MNSIDDGRRIMSKSCVIISGQTIVLDHLLFQGLCRFAEVIHNANNRLLPAILDKHRIDLILFELTCADLAEVKLILQLKNKFPLIEIVLLDDCDDSDLRAQAFAFGVRDAFRKPYKIDLIVERVQALLQQTERGPTRCRNPVV